MPGEGMTPRWVAQASRVRTPIPKKPMLRPPVLAASGLIDDDTWADCCMLHYWLPAERKQEFWRLRGDRHTKQAFLLRWGSFEQARHA